MLTRHLLTSILLCLASSKSQAGIWPFTRGSSNQGEAQNKATTPGALVIPDGIVPGSNTWCGKAATAAGQDCGLMEERKRMLLATLIANCHLESSNRPPVHWDPEDALKYASEEEVYLVMMVSGQLESLCQKFGISWSFALATKQGERFNGIHDELKRIQFAAKEMSKSGADTVESLKGVEGIGDQMQEVQRQVVEQTKAMENLAINLSKDIETIRAVGSLAFETQRTTEAAIQEFGSSLKSTLKEVPAVSDAFVRNSERLDQLMTERKHFPLMQESPATANSVMLITLVVSLGFLFTDRVYRLIFIALVIVVLKSAVASSTSDVELWSQSWADFFNPANYFLFLAFQMLNLIPYQALLLAIVLGILWEMAPSVVRNNFLGDRTILAEARLQSADLLASKIIATETVHKLESEIETTRASEKKLRAENAVYIANVMTKDNVIKDLEEQVRKSRNLRRDAANAVGSIQEQTKQANELNARQKLTILELEHEIEQYRSTVTEQNADINHLQSQFLTLQARETSANKKLAESIENRQRLANLLESKLLEDDEPHSKKVLNEEHHNLVSSLEREIEALSTQIREQGNISGRLRQDNEKLKVKAKESATRMDRLVERETKAILELQNFKKKVAREANPKPKPVKSKSFRRTSSAVQKGGVAEQFDDDYGGVRVDDDTENESSEGDDDPVPTRNDDPVPARNDDSVPARNTRSVKKAAPVTPPNKSGEKRPSGILGLFSDGSVSASDPQTPKQVRTPRLEQSAAHGAGKVTRLGRSGRRH